MPHTPKADYTSYVEVFSPPCECLGSQGCAAPGIYREKEGIIRDHGTKTERKS
jgi:hypothetical protein